MKYPIDERLIWFKNDLVPIKDAKVMIYSPTAQFGLNVFEGIPCYWNSNNNKMYAFRLNDHYNRLIRSANLLQIKCDINVGEMGDALVKVVKENDFHEDLIIRQTLFVDDFGSWRSDGPTEMSVIPIPRSINNSEYKKEGLNICVSSWRRISENNLSPRIKCGANYINSRVGQREAIRNGYDTCLFLNEFGKISEGPGSCLFIVKNDTIITPALTDSVLESITRDTVIKLSKDLGLNVIERTIDRTELYTAEEAFLCGSSMEISPIKSIDGYKLVNYKNNQLTSVIHKLYLEAAKHQNNRYLNWTTEL
jgi:branched-chain amino acid aminotransferase